MKGGIVFLVPTPPPVLPTAEAYEQEIRALRDHFGGRRYYVNPNRFLPRRWPLQLPRPLFGFLELPALRRAARRHSLYQVYSPTLYAYPMLRWLPRPVVYTLTGSALASIDSRRAPPLARLAAVTVPDRRSLAVVRNAGFANAHRVRPGIDTSRFTARPRPLSRETHLLLASAPWTHEQFRSKGIDALLEAASLDNDLRLTLLWRGVLTEELRRRVQTRGLVNRVEIVDRLADVDRHLAEAHAAIVLAERGDLVKAFPHSLMESLAAGKPVLVSREIPMADDVEERGVGVVVEEISARSLLEAIAGLRSSYDDLQRRATERGREDYALDGMIASFAAVYSAVAPSPTAGGG